MTTAPVRALSAAERRRRLARGLLRSSAITAVLLAAYYLLPLDRLADVPLWVSLALGLLALATVAAYQLRAPTRLYSPLPSYFDKSWWPSEIEVVSGR